MAIKLVTEPEINSKDIKETFQGYADNCKDIECFMMVALNKDGTSFYRTTNCNFLEKSYMLQVAQLAQFNSMIEAEDG